MLFSDLVSGFAQRWPASPQHRDHLATLVSGQSPDTFFLTCADSRIDPSGLCGCEPGSLFVARNAGNFMPANGIADGDGMVATLEYAVKALKVQHIVVMGHSDCGAMKAVQTGAPINGLPHVTAWLQNSGHGAHGDGDLLELTRANVVQQLDNLRTYDFVVAAGVQLHGWYLDFANSRIEAYDSAQSSFLPLETLYKS